MQKVRVTYYFTAKTVERLNNLSRKQLHNKSQVVESLVIKWLDEVEANQKEQ
jgi:predicted DNA-binding protein